MAVPKTSGTADPSHSLLNPRHELYTRLLAKGGISQSAAYDRALPSRTARTAATLKANATRLAKTPAVAARILFLRKQRSDGHVVGAEITSADVARHMAEITASLTEAHTLGEKLGVAPQVLVKLRRVISVHVGRLGRLKPPSVDRSDSVAGPL